MFFLDDLHLSPDADAGGGTPEPPEPTDTANGGGNGDAATFTQADLNRLVGEARTKARDSATAALLGELGVKDAAELRQQLSKLQKLETESMSELEKAAARVIELETAVSGYDGAKQQLEAQNDVIGQLVEQRMKELNVPKHVAALLDGKTAVEKLAYLNDNADVFVAQLLPSTDGGRRGKGVGLTIEKRIAAKRRKGNYGSGL